MRRRDVLRAGALGWLGRAGVLRAGPDTAADADPLGRWLARRQRESRVVGVAAALVVDGKPAWKGAFGHADRAAGIAMTTGTQVGIGSVTKTFTALAAMQLQAQGTVDIGQPLSRYLPRFRMRTHGENLGGVTLERLITHSAGVPTDVFRDMERDRAGYTDVVELLDRTAMAHPPGLVGLYSNAGYSLLAHALSEAGGIGYPEYLQQRVFAPLGMERTGFADIPPGATRSRAYGADGAEAVAFELRDIASGGIYSTADDLARYAIALMAAYHGEASPIADRSTMRAMFGLRTDIPIDTNKKGLGWFLFRNEGDFAAYHAGSTFYANAAVLLVPEQRAAAAILANTVGGDAVCEAFAFRFLERYGLSAKDIVPEPGAVPKAGAANARSLHVGYYAQKHGYAKVEDTGAGLAIRHGDGTCRTTETAPGVFAVQDGEARAALYYFRDIGPYHVLFLRQGPRERQLGYRVATAPPDARWTQRLGRYRPFGYAMPGFERIVEAEIRLQDDGLPVLEVAYNTGKFTYPMLPLTPDEARTGGLGPSMTGDAVSFADDPQGEVMTYLGLTFRRDCGDPIARCSARSQEDLQPEDSA